MIKINILDNFVDSFLKNLPKNFSLKEKEWPRRHWFVNEGKVTEEWPTENTTPDIEGSKNSLQISRTSRECSEIPADLRSAKVVYEDKKIYIITSFGDSCNKTTFQHPWGAFYENKLIGVDPIKGICFVEKKVNNEVKKISEIDLETYYGAIYLEEKKYKKIKVGDYTPSGKIKLLPGFNETKIKNYVNWRYCVGLESISNLITEGKEVFYYSD